MIGKVKLHRAGGEKGGEKADLSEDPYWLIPKFKGLSS